MLRCDVFLRPCTAADLEPLETWAPTGNSRTHEVGFARQERGTSTYVLAACRQAPQQLVGSCEVRWDGCAAPEVPRCPEVDGLQVWPEHLQSRGIGTQVLRRLEDEAWARGHRVLGLGVDDPRARALYLRLGYADTGVVHADRCSWVDEHHEVHEVAERNRWLTRDLAGPASS